jgi:hypothetical protein
VTVSGNYVYLANGSDGLRLYNIANPAQPVSVGNANNGGSAENVVVSGNYAYLANYTDGMRIYDVTTPSNPVSVGNAPAGAGTTYGVAVSGTNIFVANGDDGLRVYGATFAGPALVLHVSTTTSNSVLISWPAPATGFTLKQNLNLSTTNWTLVTNVPVTNGSSQQIAISPLSGKNFYRLSSP